VGGSVTDWIGHVSRMRDSTNTYNILVRGAEVSFKAAVQTL
jgi:hypothetical protein